MNKLTYYLFNRVPGTHESWTLAVLAVGKKDADNYIKINHPGSKYAGKVENGKVNASCGAVTDSAAVELRKNIFK